MAKSDIRLGLFLFGIALVISIIASAIAPRFISHPPVGGPNSDLAKHMYALVDNARLPWHSRMEPGYVLYMSLKLKAARLLGVSYSDVRFLDSGLWALQAYLVYGLAQILGAPRFRAGLIGLLYAVNPLGLALTAIDNRMTLATAFLFAGILIALMGLNGPAINSWRLVAGGCLFGIGSTIRTDQVLMPLVLAIPVGCILFDRRKPISSLAQGLFAVAAISLGFLLMFAPWKMSFERHGDMKMYSKTPTYMHWVGLAKYREIPMGREAADLIVAGKVDGSWQQVIRFHTDHFKQEPISWLRFWAKSLTGTWYVSESRRWDHINLVIAIPYLAAGLTGFFLMMIQGRTSSFHWIPVILFLYLWLGSTFFSGIGRYMVPLYWVLGFFAVEGLSPTIRQAYAARPAGHK